MDGSISSQDNGAEIIYQSPKIRRRVTSHNANYDDIKCSTCTLNKDETQSNGNVCCYCDGEPNFERGPDVYPERCCSSRQACQKENNLNYYNCDCSGFSGDKIEIRCPECLNEATRNEFWKNYDNVDEVPVKDICYETTQGVMKSLDPSITNNIEIDSLIISNDKNHENSAILGDTIIDAAKIVSSVLLENEKIIKGLDKTSIELQTDESTLQNDRSSEDFFNALVKNILDKLVVGKNDVQKFYKDNYEQCLLTNRDKCRCAVEKVIQNMIQELKINESTDSNESVSKEEEIASFNYKGDCTTDTDNLAISTTSIKKIKTISNEPGKFNYGHSRNIMITTETTIRKEVQLPKLHSQEIENNFTSTDIVQKLLLKCLDVAKSELECKLENSNSHNDKRIHSDTFHNDKRSNIHSNEPNPGTLKNILPNAEQTQDSFSMKIEGQATKKEKFDIDKVVTKLSDIIGEKELNKLIDKESENAIKAYIERKFTSENSIEKPIFKTKSNADDKLMEKARRREVFSTSEILTKRSKSAFEDIERYSKSQIPVKSSCARNDLRCDDSGIKTKSSDFERRSLLAKICFLFCRTFCKN